MVAGLIDAWIGQNGVRKLEYNKFIARYMYHRLSSGGTYGPYYVPIIRQTIEKLVQHPSVKDDHANREHLERSACACKATLSGQSMMNPSARDGADQSESEMEANCLALAAWLGDLELVKSLHTGSDPDSFFGRPSWAAAARGHQDIVRFCLDHGALPYYDRRWYGYYCGERNPLAAAAFMGHESVVRLYLERPFFNFPLAEFEDPVDSHRLARECIWHQVNATCGYAAQGNHVNILKLLFDHYALEYPSIITSSFKSACYGGSTETAKFALESGANLTGALCSSSLCLNRAARSGSVSLVKWLASLEKTRQAGGVLPRAWREAWLRGNREMMLAIMPNRPLP